MASPQVASTFLALPGSMRAVTQPAVSHLKAQVRRRSAQVGLRSDAALAEAAGVPYRTLVNLLAGKATRAEHAVELTLGWGAGSVAAVRSGGEPTVTSENAGPQREVDRAPVGPPPEGAEYVALSDPESESIPPGTARELLEEIRRVAKDVEDIKRRLGDGS